MTFLSGISYNIKGLKLGLRTPKLLMLGMVRFVLFAVLVVVCAVLVFEYYEKIFSMLWQKPESAWLVWLWYLLSWIVGLILFGFSALVAYLLGQIAFAVFIMDLMAQITERIVTGDVSKPSDDSFFAQMFHLIKQEIPRAVIPILLTVLLVVLGWITPLGPVLTVLLSAVAAIFLAWDNTDLIPARNLVPFNRRFRMLRDNWMFHLGFGICFLIPAANIVFLSFAPVGGALYVIENRNIYP